MKFRARYRGKGANGKYVTTQMFINAANELEAKEEANKRISEVTKRLVEREGQEVGPVVCWKIEPHEQKKRKEKEYVCFISKNPSSPARRRLQSRPVAGSS